MNVARFATRHSRAILLAIVLVSLAGVWAMRTLPSNIYPEVEFPRIVIVAHSGDLRRAWCSWPSPGRSKRPPAPCSARVG